MRVAIIGAGVSGIAALKCCMEENLTAVCFERNDTFGGLWEHNANPVPNETTATKQVVCNTSKEIMAFSDFPPPQEFPLYLPQYKYKEYLQLYVKNFDLEKNMKFNKKVQKCEYKENKWNLTVEDLKTNVIHDEIFDALMVCNGIFSKPIMPEYSGIATFSGQILHSQLYRKASDFSGKRVLVIGIGNTGSETAVELTTQAKQVYASTRNGRWIGKRLTPVGLPIDVQFLKRVSGFFLKFVPRKFQQLWFENLLALNHKFFGLNQKSNISAKTITINDEIIDKISCGKLILKPDVERFTACDVYFVDGTVASDIDVVIFAAGYEIDFPFLDKSALKIKDNKLFAYKHMFPPELIDKNFAVIGCMFTFGASAPLHESQSRLATRVFKGLVKLPPQKVILEEINATLDTQRSVDPISYQDALYEFIGCKPNICHLLLSDPYLGLNVFVGPCTPYQFRLTGPGKWAGARSAILDQWKRMHYPTNKHLKSSLPPWIKDFLIAFVIFFVLIQIFIFGTYLSK